MLSNPRLKKEVRQKKEKERDRLMAEAESAEQRIDELEGMEIVEVSAARRRTLKELIKDSEFYVEKNEGNPRLAARVAEYKRDIAKWEAELKGQKKPKR
jgi:hypothetical protein